MKPSATISARVRALLIAALVVLPVVADISTSTEAWAAPNNFVTMSDGVDIAVNVSYPPGHVPGVTTWPTVFVMDGYDGGSAEGKTLFGQAKAPLGDAVPDRLPGNLQFADDSHQLSDPFADRYVRVHASIRGTGCSGGAFDQYSWRTALDGYELVEWAAGQPWSDGQVAILGHSYSGMTGYAVAAMRPPHLKAVSVSGLIDDVYRGMVYPGGVSNYGFPLLWSAAIRPTYEVFGGSAPGIVRPEESDDPGDRQEKCLANTLDQPSNPVGAVTGGESELINDWWRTISLISYENGWIAANAHDPAAAEAAGKSNRDYGVTAPIHITGAHQDEETGPRGFTHLWESVAAGVPKRLVISNGDHGTQNPCCSGDRILEDRMAWIDHWTGTADHTDRFGTAQTAGTSVEVLLEKDHNHIGGVITDTKFPLTGTQWTDVYLRSGGGLTFGDAPGADEGTSEYLSGTGRQSWLWPAGDEVSPPATSAEGPDEATFRTEAFDSDTTVAGPMTATLWATTDTYRGADLFVQLIDEAPNGDRLYLQRGLLRTTHAEYDPDLSDKDGGVIYRPYRHHESIVVPERGVAKEYLIEVFPLAHVFRTGHRLVVKVHAAPAVDSYFAFVPRQDPGRVTLHHDAAHPSRLTVPVVSTPVDLSTEGLPCDRHEGVRCVQSTIPGT